MLKRMYANCVQAVKEKSNPDGNVNMDKKKVKCDHEATSCVMVGYSSPLYACCANAPKSPQRVYSQGMRFKDLKEVKN